MNLILNGKKIVVSEKMTLAELLCEQNLTTQNAAVAINREFLPREQYRKTTLKSNDEIEVVNPMQGG